MILNIIIGILKLTFFFSVTDLEELWSGITYDLNKEELIWEPLCPVKVSVSLCHVDEGKGCRDVGKVFHSEGQKVCSLPRNPLFHFITSAVTVADCQGPFHHFLLLLPQVVFSSVDPHPTLCTKVECFLLLIFFHSEMKILSSFTYPRDPKQMIFFLPWNTKGEM